MDIVEFRIEQNDAYDLVFQILVNSVPLGTLAGEFELPRYKLNSAYVGLPCSEVAEPVRHYLGRGDSFRIQNERVQVLGCSCGSSACWPLECRIDAGPDVVTWSDFQQPFRRKDSIEGHWSCEGFGPFVFDRRQYERALHALRPAAIA